MRIVLSCILLMGLIASSAATVERILDMALKILPSVIKDAKKLEMFTVGSEHLLSQYSNFEK